MLEIRLKLLLAFIIVCLLTVSGRLFYVQAMSSAQYDEMAEKQRLRVIEIPSKRGEILDRNGSELAVNILMDSVYATPYLIDDPKSFAKKLAPILKKDERELLDSLIKQSGFMYLVRKTDSKTLAQIKKIVEEDKVKGIGYIKETKRYYPNGKLAGHVLGFAGMDNHGLGGLELEYNEYLYGKPGRIVAERDGQGRPIPRSTKSSSRPIDGAGIKITIDREIQYKAELELAKAVEDYEAKSGSIIVMSPKTGEIYAMANVPCYDPNKLETLDDDNLRNKAITDLYEPGSTIKAMIAAIALEEDVCSPSTAFYLEPTIRVGSKNIKESHPRPAKNFTFAEIVRESSNVGMVKVGVMLGKERIDEYLKRFEFNKTCDIDFPGEARGYYPQVENWSKMSLANISFGQGICTTQLAMTKALATIANDGVPVRPRFLIEAAGPRGRIVEKTEIVNGKRVLSAATAGRMKEILEGAVLEGTGGPAKVTGYRVGGKTGTAQKAKVGGLGYEQGKYIASFMGIIPMHDPQLVISVVIDEPQRDIYGGSVAAPVFSEVAEFSLRHLKIPPE
ncbi:MAG: penicillin-binding protein 2 [Actinobacteria bacterium]|nr:penicillin-binding protein 2 [Actinomycetota bacterium]